MTPEERDAVLRRGPTEKEMLDVIGLEKLLAIERATVEK